MKDIVKEIKTRGYRVVRIHPEVHSPDPDLPLASLEEAVRKSTVAFRGWDFPHYDLKNDPVRANDYVEQSIDWAHYIELWRAYRSKQFISLSGIPDDWRGRAGLWAAPEGWRPGASLRVDDTIFRLIEIFEFAARWCRNFDIRGSVAIALEVHGLENRALELGPNRHGFFSPRTCRVPSWSYARSYSPAELLATPRDLSVPLALKFFELFGWDAKAEVIREIQNDLGR